MIHTFQPESNSESDNNLYDAARLSAIARFSKERIPVYARVTGYTLLLEGEGKDFQSELKIDEIAALNMVSRSMTIYSLKMLVELNIFHKEERINKPCVYRFNYEDNWLQYSTPEPKNKVVQIFGDAEEEAGEKEIETSTNVWGVQDTPQEEQPSYEVTYASLPLLAPKPKAILVSDTCIRSYDGGNRAWEMTTNTDMESGEEIERIMKEEGLTVTKAVSQVVKLAKEVIKIFAELKIAFRITDLPVEACKRLVAIASMGLPKPKKEIPQEQSIPIYSEYKQGQIDSQNEYLSVLQKMGYVSSERKIKNGCITIFEIGADGRIEVSSRSVADLMNEWPNPEICFGEKFLLWKQGTDNYQYQTFYAS